MDTNKANNKFYTNLILGTGLTLFTCFAAYQFSNVMFEGKNYIASINGRYITTDEFKQRMNTVKMQYASQMGTDFKTEAGQKMFTELRANVMKELILTKIILADADQEKIVVTDPMVDQEIEKIKSMNFRNNDSEFRKALKKNNLTPEGLRKVLKEKMTMQKFVEKLFNDNIKVSDADVKKAYEEKKKDYIVPETIQASHILVKTEAEANKIEDELKAGASFEELARKYSTDPGSKVKGGDLGYFGRGMMVPEFEKAAYGLKIGEISPPVKSQFGYHIIKKTGVRPERVMPYEQVKTNLEQQLKSDKQRDFFDKWREKAMKETEVKYNQGYESYSVAEKKEEPKAEASTPPSSEKSKPADEPSKADTTNKDVKGNEQAKATASPAASPADTKSSEAQTSNSDDSKK